MFSRFIMALAAGSVAVAAEAADLDLSQPAEGQSPVLGIAFPGNAPEYYGLIQDMGMSWARISASWGRIGGGGKEPDWTDLDRRIDGLQARGIQPFVTFESDADWATDPATHKVKNATPLDINAWQLFVAQVVERYDGDGNADMKGLRQPVRMWQAANEFVSETNASGGWAGTTDQLIAYVNAAHDGVKLADPKGTFVLGGTAAFVMDVALVNQGRADWTVRQFWNDGSELVFPPAKSRIAEVDALVAGKLLPVLRKARYDVADVHLYGPEDRDPLRLKAMQDWSGRPVLSSECGGPNLDYGDSYSPQAHFMAVVARNLNVLAHGGQACLWFGLGEEMQTTVGNARVPLYDMQRQPKPGVYAYRLLSRLLPKGAVVRQIADGWEISAGDGRMVQLFPHGGAGDPSITHCVLPEAPNRVLRVTESVNCSNAMLVFKADLGTDILNK